MNINGHEYTVSDPTFGRFVDVRHQKLAPELAQVVLMVTVDGVHRDAEWWSARSLTEVNAVLEALVPEIEALVGNVSSASASGSQPSPSRSESPPLRHAG